MFTVRDKGSLSYEAWVCCCKSSRRVSIAGGILVVGLRSFSTKRGTLTFVQKLSYVCVTVRDPDLRGLHAKTIL